MKKTLVALTVTALASSVASAATVYEQNGSKVDVGGSLRILLTKNSGERGDLKNKGSRFVVKGSQNLGNGLSALANVELRFEGNDGEDDFGNIETKRLYAGFKQDDIGTLTFGRQLTNADDLGLSDYTYDLGGVNQTETSGQKVVKFRSAEWSGFSFGADYLFDKDETQSKNGGKRTRGWGVAAFYSAELTNDMTYNFSGGFTQTHDADVRPHKEKAFIVSSELVTGPFSIAVDYSQRKSTKSVNSVEYRAFSGSINRTLNFNKKREIGLGLKYQYVGNSSIYGQYIWGKGSTAEISSAADLHAWILGTDYKWHKNVVTYLEGGSFKYKRNGNYQDGGDRKSVV